MARRLFRELELFVRSRPCYSGSVVLSTSIMQEAACRWLYPSLGFEVASRKDMRPAIIPGLAVRGLWVFYFRRTPAEPEQQATSAP